MSENIAQTVQKVIQDEVAPDLRELKATVAANQKQNDHQFTALQKQMDQHFQAVDSASTRRTRFWTRNSRPSWPRSPK